MRLPTGVLFGTAVAGAALFVATDPAAAEPYGGYAHYTRSYAVNYGPRYDVPVRHVTYARPSCNTGYGYDRVRYVAPVRERVYYPAPVAYRAYSPYRHHVRHHRHHHRGVRYLHHGRHRSHRGFGFGIHAGRGYRGGRHAGFSLHID